jgi:hypothetical protein
MTTNDLLFASSATAAVVRRIVVVADDVEDLQFTRAGRGQQQIRIVARQASRAYQGTGARDLDCARKPRISRTTAFTL